MIVIGLSEWMMICLDDSLKNYFLFSWQKLEATLQKQTGKAIF